MSEYCIMKESGRRLMNKNAYDMSDIKLGCFSCYTVKSNVSFAEWFVLFGVF